MKCVCPARHARTPLFTRRTVCLRRLGELCAGSGMPRSDMHIPVGFISENRLSEAALSGDGRVRAQHFQRSRYEREVSRARQRHAPQRGTLTAGVHLCK